MSESEEVATAVKAAFLVMFYTLKGSNDSYFNESLEVAELKYQQALKRLKRAYPGSAFCGWGLSSAKNMCNWTVDLEKKGFPIAAAQQAAKAFNLKRRDESAVCVPNQADDIPRVAPDILRRVAGGSK